METGSFLFVRKYVAMLVSSNGIRVGGGQEETDRAHGEKGVPKGSPLAEGLLGEGPGQGQGNRCPS